MSMYTVARTIVDYFFLVHLRCVWKVYVLADK